MSSRSSSEGEAVDRVRKADGSIAAERIADLSDADSDEIQPASQSAKRRDRVSDSDGGSAQSDGSDRRPRKRARSREGSVSRYRSRSPSRSRSHSPSRSPTHRPSGSRSRSRSRSPSRSQSPPRLLVREESRSPPRPVEAHERVVLHRQLPAKDNPAHILHLPPALNVSFTVGGDQKGDSQNAGPSNMPQVAYRLKRNVRGDPVDSIMRVLEKGGPSALSEILESNTNLVTWPDGSQTLVVGNQQYEIVNDALVSDHFIFRKGQDVQTFESRVKAVGRVHVSSVAGARSQLSMSNSAALLPGRRREGRTIKLTMKEGGEMEEKLAKEANLKKERERARLEAKRRASNIERHHPRPRSSSQSAAYSEPEESDGEAEKWADLQAHMQMKRQNRISDLSVARHKAGGRRVLEREDDSEEEESA